MASFAEFIGFANNVVGGQHEYEGIAIAFGREQGRISATAKPESRRIGSSTMSASTPRSRDCSATTKRKSALVVTIGRERAGMRNARQHLVERRSLSDERNELLGHALA